MSIVDGLMCVPPSWRIDWGSVPDWFGGLGTVGALLFGVLSLRREIRARRREERAARARQARLVSTTARIEGGGMLRVLVANDSDGPVFDLVTVPEVYAGPPARGGTPVPVTAVTGPVDRLDGGSSAQLFVTVDRTVDLTGYESATVELRFTDQQGNRWRRKGSAQPEPELDGEPTAGGSWLSRRRR
jgi:hypothetical protein